MPKNVDWHDASSVRAAAFSQIAAGFSSQPIQSTGRNVIFELPIPFTCIKVGIPLAEHFRMLNWPIGPCRSFESGVPHPVIRTFFRL